LENPNLKGLLRRVLGKIFNELEIKGWCKEHQGTNRLTSPAVTPVSAASDESTSSSVPHAV
jgi:hypothetical protein